MTNLEAKGTKRSAVLNEVLRTFYFDPICTLQNFSLKVVGPTHAKIIASQFSRLRRGDRFFYDDTTDQNVAFKPRQLALIKKITFAHILCNNLNPISSPSSHRKYRI